MGSPHGVQRPEQGGLSAEMAQRISGLAKRNIPAGPGAGVATIADAPARTTFPMPFSFAGSLSVSESPRYYPHIATRLVTVHAALGTAGTSNTVVTIKKNGTSLGTLTLSSGAHTTTADFFEAMTSDLDYLTVAVTTVGSGAADLTVQARFG